jgi:hypothetical protein
MQPQPFRQNGKIGGSLRQAGEHTQFHCTQKRLGCPESHAELQKALRCYLAHLFSPAALFIYQMPSRLAKGHILQDAVT